MHRRLVDAHDLIVALYHGVAEVAALFGHRLEPSEARWTLRACGRAGDMILYLTARNAVGASCAVGGRVTIPPHVWLGVSGESMRYAWRVEPLRRSTPRCASSGCAHTSCRAWAASRDHRATIEATSSALVQFTIAGGSHG